MGWEGFVRRRHPQGLTSPIPGKGMGMTYRQTIEHPICERVQLDCGSDPFPENLRDAIDWLQERLDSLPEDMREGAYVRFEEETYYDSSYVVMTIKGARPETDEEMSERLASEAARLRAAQRAAADQERALFEALRKKYEGV